MERRQLILRILIVLGFGFLLIAFNLLFLAQRSLSIQSIEKERPLYVVIAPDKTMGILSPLMQLRERQGFQVGFVPLEMVRDQLQGFSQRICKGSFLLLVGSHHTQNAQYLLSSIKESRRVRFLNRPIPTANRIYEKNLRYLSDTDYSDQGRHVVGRFPARNDIELKNMVAKTLRWESRKGTIKSAYIFSRDGGFSEDIDKFIKSCGDVGAKLMLKNRVKVQHFHSSMGNINTTPQVLTDLKSSPDLVIHAGLGGSNFSSMLSYSKLRRIDTHTGPWVILGGHSTQRVRSSANRLIRHKFGPPLVLGHASVSHPYTDAMFSLSLIKHLRNKNEFRAGELLSQSLKELSQNHFLHASMAKITRDITGLTKKDMDNLRLHHRKSLQIIGDPALTLGH